MKIPFVKMHGAGNDYIYIDGYRTPVDEPSALARRISDRHRGVGSDGLIVIQPSDRADARMAMYNADGSEGLMCGNGLRCLVKFLFDRGRVGERCTIETKSGLVPVRVTLRDRHGLAVELCAELRAPRFRRAEIPLCAAASERSSSENSSSEEAMDLALDLEGRIRGSAVNMGNPHFVIFVDDVEQAPLARLGPAIESHPWFPERTNVEFVQVLSRSELIQRTWERGSGETMACGSGACAVQVIAHRLGRTDEEATIHLRGGDLRVRWPGTGHPVHLTGPAEEVFSGSF